MSTFRNLAFVIPLALTYLLPFSVFASESSRGRGYPATTIASAKVDSESGSSVDNGAGSCINTSRGFGVNNSGEDAPQVGEPKENLLSKAIALYRCRQFANAANDLGAALPSEFNNPLLHYYYANCMVHLRHKESAIREYRIAYALQPSGTVGEYCRLCLDRFGIDAEGKKLPQPKSPSSKQGGKNTGPEIPEPPTAAELAALKANPKDGSESAIAREKAVENLRDLMQQKKRANGAPLPSIVGTNLYVRNYKEQVLPQAKIAEVSKPVEAAKQVPLGASRDKSAFPFKGFKLWWW